MQANIQHRIVQQTLHISHQSELLALKKQIAAMQAQIEELDRSLNQSTDQAAPSATIKVPVTDGYQWVSCDEILYCQAAGSYTRVVTGTKTYMLSIVLKSVEKLLPQQIFIRCHQSYSINKMQIKSVIKKDGLHIILPNGTKIPVSRRNKARVLNCILF